MDRLRSVLRCACAVATLAAFLTLGAKLASAQNDTAGEPIRSASPLRSGFYSGGYTGQRGSAQLEPYTHITSTDNFDPSSFWYTYRPNILNQDVPDTWDAMKLINTDRPDFTDVATTVGKGVTQVETGWTYSYRNTAIDHFREHTLPEVNVRIGTTDNFEWRIKWTGVAFTNETTLPSLQTANLSGTTDPSIGFKWAVTKQRDWRPMHTIVTQLFVPAGSNDFSGHEIQGGVNWVYNWQVRKWLFVRGSTGVDFFNNPVTNFTGGSPVPFTIGREHVTQGHQSVSAYWQISQRWGLFTEWFMLFRHGTGRTDNRPDHFHDYGLYYYISPNLQLDARVGQELNPGINAFFTGAGISFRY